MWKECWLKGDGSALGNTMEIAMTSAKVNLLSHRRPCLPQPQASQIGASTTTTVPAMFRRFFTTTARLFHKSNGKPPAQGPTVPPPPSNNRKPNSNPGKDEDVNFFEHARATLNPRSKHFVFAFANPKLPTEERSKNLLFATLATFTAWATEPWMMPMGQDQW